MANKTEGYPLTKFYFSVNWGKKSGEMSFQEVTGLEMSREKAEYRGGMDKGFTKKQVPGLNNFGELTLKKGTFAGDDDFFKWWKGGDDFTPERRDLNIKLRDSAGKIKMTWNVRKAFPTKLTSTELGAEKNEIAIETLVLVHEGISVKAEDN